MTQLGCPHTSALVDPGNLVAADCDVRASNPRLMVAAAETGNERTREWVTLSQTTISSSQLEPEGVPPKVTYVARLVVSSLNPPARGSRAGDPCQA